MRILAIAAVAGLVLRLLVLPLAVGRVPVGDPFNYLAIAENMLAGRGMVIDDPKLVADLRAFYPPLYPAMLAAIGLAAPLKPPTLLALNFLIDLATAGSMIWLGRLAGAGKAALAASAVYLLWPANIFLSPLAHKEGLAALFAVLTAALILRCASRPTLAWAAALGIVAGLGALNQPGLALLPAVFALALLPEFASKQAWLRTMAVAATVAAVVMVPWWIRNFLIFDRFVPLTTSGGIGLWIGAAPHGDGSWIQPGRHLLRGDELDLSRAAFAEAWAWISADPLGYVAHCLAKLPPAFLSETGSLGRLFSMHPSPGMPPVSLIAVSAASQLALLAAAIAGAFRVRGVLLRLAAACLAHVLLFQIWFEFSERHRLFLNPFLMLLAACAVYGVLKLRASGSRSLSAAS